MFGMIWQENWTQVRQLQKGRSNYYTTTLTNDVEEARLNRYNASWIIVKQI